MVAELAAARSDRSPPTSPRIGVLSVQGAFAAHGHVLSRMGATVVRVRAPSDLEVVEGLVLPGGESTAMTLISRSNGLWNALDGVLRSGIPVLATCAGVILLASEVRDGRADQRWFGTVDLTVRRNGYGRQVDSFEADLAVKAHVGAFPGVFIRAPVIERVGADVEVLAEVAQRDSRHTPVLCRSGRTVLATFHPELTTDTRVHLMAFGPLLGATPNGAQLFPPGCRAVAETAGVVHT